MSTKKAFSAASYHLVFHIIQASLAILAAFNVQFSQPISELSDAMATTISTQGVYAVAGMLIVSVLAPVYSAIQKKSFKAIWSSANTYIYLGTGGLSLLTLVGLELPPDSPEIIVNAIFAKDWGTLGGILFTLAASIITRILKDKEAKAKANAGL